MQLKNNIMNIDYHSSKMVDLDKFQIESNALGINLSNDDISTIVQLFGEPPSDQYSQYPKINYEKAIRYLVPILSKNQDK